MNPALANHPQVAKSLKTLRQWGVRVLEPHPAGDLLVMVSVEEIVAAVKAALT